MNDDAAFRLATFLVTAARDVVDEPAIYAPFRMIDAVDRFIAAESSDEFLQSVQPLIATEKNTVMTDREAFIALLDRLAESFALEAKRRNLASG